MRNTCRVILLLLIAGCAKIVAPTGGPEDREPPVIERVTPEPGYTDTIPSRVVIGYSERLREDEGLVQVYPGPGDITFTGRGIAVASGESLDVLTITVSGDLQDIRGNRTDEPVTLVWNTMPESAFAGVRGLVSRTGGGSVTETTRCDLYLMPDTGSALLTGFPDSTGVVNAGWLPPGEYILQCYEDNDRSRSWNPEREPGVRERALLEAGEIQEVSLSMSITDSIGPLVSAVEPLDGWHLEIQWNEQVSAPGETSGHVTVTDPDGDAVEVLGLSASAGRSSTGRLTVYTGEMRDTLYIISIQGIRDLAGNPSLPDTLEFWGIDSLPEQDLMVQSAYPEDGGIDVPPGGPFMISFSDYVDLEAIDSLYSVVRVADSVSVQGTLSRTSPVSFSFTPEMELLGERQYRIDLDSGLVSLQGDTLEGRSWTFRPAWSDMPGSISGSISGISAGTVTLIAASAGGGDGSYTGEYSPGEYVLESIPGGRYTVSCFLDRNGNSRWDPGEPYGAWPGVVEVFPGMDTPGTDIQVVP